MASEFGPYRLLRRIAAGGMGEVYLAVLEKGDFRKPLALKRILPGCSDQKDFVRRFSQEAALLGLLNHANIVHIFDYGCLENQFYLAMELVEGPDLSALLQAGGRLRPPLAAEVLVQLCRALSHAHERTLPDGRPAGVAHGDLSPQNVLITAGGQVKLADFGVARLLEAASGEEGVAGKAAYLSPEQARGEPACAFSDLYSLALVAAEMLAGEKARSGDVPQMLLAAQRGEMPPLDGICAGSPPAWREFLEKALQPDPGRRFQSAAEMCRFAVEKLAPQGPEALGAEVAARLPALAAARSGPEPTQAAAVPVARLARPTARQPVWSVAVLLLLFAAAGLWWWLQREPERKPFAPASERPLPAELTAEEIFSPGFTPAQPMGKKADEGSPPVWRPEPAGRSNRQIRPVAKILPAAARDAAEPVGIITVAGPWRALLDGKSVSGERIALSARRLQILQLNHQNRPAQITLRLAPAEDGWRLAVNSRPWLQLELNQQLLGQTPRVNLALSAGRHRLRLFRDDQGQDADLQISLPE